MDAVSDLFIEAWRHPVTIGDLISWAILSSVLGGSFNLFIHWVRNSG